MNKFILWLRNSFNISVTEANGFVVFLFLLFLMTMGIFWLKYAGPVITDSLANEKKADSLLAVIRAHAVYDTADHSGSKPYIPYFTKKKKALTTHIADPAEKKSNYSSRIILRPFDINKADTVQLKQLKGIGRVLSRRIIKYRDLLGGFVSKKQLNEVYGLSDSVILQLDTLTYVLTDYQPRHIDINHLNEFDLKKHPYISKKLAKAITAYRFQHGKFSSIDDLHTIHLLDTLTLARIEPYIKF